MIERVDVAVVGAGPGGLSAAQAAAQAGARVALIESHRHPGGQYFRQPVTPRGRESSARQRQGQALWEQAAAAGAQLLLNTVVWGLVEGNPLRLALHTAQQAAALLKIEAQALILATGAHDRPVAFPSWTLPGVITAGAAQTLLKEQGVSPGTRVLLAGTGPLQLVVAADLVRAGVEVVGVLEGSRLLRDGLRHAAALWGQWERLDEGLRSSVTLRRHHVPLRNGWGIVAAEGREQVERATIARLDEQWRPISGSEETLACDTVCLGYGFIPLNTLSRLVGAWQEWRPDLGGEVPVRDARMQTSVPGVYAVGDGAGIGGAALAMVEGRIAGIAAAAGAGHGAAAAETAIQQLAPPLARERRFQQMYAALFTPGPGLYELSRDDTILCRCEEVTQAEVRRAVARGADSTGEVKAITRCGMGNCQGRMCSHLVAHCVARETGRSVAEVGLFRPRPPIFPVPVEALAHSWADGPVSSRQEGVQP